MPVGLMNATRSREHKMKRGGLAMANETLPKIAKAEAVEVLVVDHQRRPEGHGQEPGGRRRSQLGASWSASGGTALVVRRKRCGALAAVASRCSPRRVPGHGRLRSHPIERVDVRQRHTTVLYKAGPPVLMSR